MEYRLKEIDLHSGNEADLQDLVTIAQRINQTIFPEDPVEPDEVIKQQILVLLDPKEQTLHGGIIYEPNSNNLIGFYFHGWFAEGSERAKGNEMIGFIEMQIDPKYRKKGIGGALFEKLEDKIKETGRRVVIANTVESGGKSFLKNRGYQFALTMPIYQAKFEDVDWKMMEEWRREGETQNPDTELRIYDTFPEDIIEEYSETFTKTHEQIPMEELQIQDMEYTPEYLKESYEKDVKMGLTRLTAVIVEKTRKISGFAYLKYSKTREPIIDVGITAVLESERGRKLGKWLKAASMLDAKSRYPNLDQVRTGVATSNAPMLSINQRIGFKLYKEQIMAQKMFE